MENLILHAFEPDPWHDIDPSHPFRCPFCVDAFEKGRMLDMVAHAMAYHTAHCSPSELCFGYVCVAANLRRSGDKFLGLITHCESAIKFIESAATKIERSPPTLLPTAHPDANAHSAVSRPPAPTTAHVETHQHGDGIMQHPDHPDRARIGTSVSNRRAS